MVALCTVRRCKEEDLERLVKQVDTCSLSLKPATHDVLLLACAVLPYHRYHQDKISKTGTNRPFTALFCSSFPASLLLPSLHDCVFFCDNVVVQRHTRLFPSWDAKAAAKVSLFVVLSFVNC